jgi:nicotinamidase-related amidase
VLFTANDAYMRDYKLFVPSDCVVSNTEEENSYALKQMQEILKATVLPAAELDFQKLKSVPDQGGGLDPVSTTSR